jgi:hypothetical protein
VADLLFYVYDLQFQWQSQRCYVSNMVLCLLNGVWVSQIVRQASGRDRLAFGGSLVFIFHFAQRCDLTTAIPTYCDLAAMVQTGER